jgi:predicted dehydrogenase
MTASPIRVGIIGSGDIAQAHYKGYVAAGAKVVAVCDTDIDRLAARQHDWDVSTGYTDAADLLADNSIDAVSICTPNSSHHPITMAAAKKGKHILCEKPVSLDIAQGEEMVAACETAGVVFQVGHHMRSWAAATKAKELIDSGAIGRVCEIRLRQSHDWGGGEPRGVFGSKAHSGGGTLLDNGCHLFDLARYLGGEVNQVYARIATLKYEVEVEDTAVANLDFASGAIGLVEAAWTATGFQEAFWVYGTEGSVECDNLVSADTLVHRFRIANTKSWSDPSVARYELTAPVAHTQHVANFLAAIEGKREVICTGRDGIEAVRLVLACYKSAETKVPVGLAR